MSSNHVFIDSEKIQIFPSSIDREKFPYARILTEGHILDLIRSSSISSSFVLTDVFSLDTSFEFVINGYYVKLDATQETPHNFFKNEDTDVYAHIYIDTTSIDHPQLCGSDQTPVGGNTKFTAVSFSSDNSPSPSDVFVTNGVDEKNYQHFYLHILTKRDSKWIIPPASRRTVDGGEID